jgi:hypothetical protein
MIAALVFLPAFLHLRDIRRMRRLRETPREAVVLSIAASHSITATHGKAA